MLRYQQINKHGREEHAALSPSEKWAAFCFFGPKLRGGGGVRVGLYAVRTGKERLTVFTIDWQTDLLYWRGRVDEFVRLREQVPLGAAEIICHSLREVWGNAACDGVSDLEETFLREAGSAGYRGETERFPLEPEKIGGDSRDAEQLGEAARLAAACLAGRSLLREEALRLLDAALPGSLGVSPLAALQLAALQGALRLTAAVAPDPGAASPSRGLRYWAERLRLARPLLGRAFGRRPQELRCRRCGSGEDKLRRTDCAACGQACAYCEACLTMGRSRECELLVVGAPEAAVAGALRLASRVLNVPAEANRLVERWGLSPAQSDAAARALAFLEDARASRGRSFLLWAVTGAGKTEMIFPLLESVLLRGGRALVATPRRDVVLELAPRLAKAFPGVSLVVLYGGSQDRWRSGALTLATTHQLLRFQAAFDLVLIDELDAFPYHNDPMLHYAAAKSGKPEGRTVYLSATPPATMQREASRGRLAYARVPVRYHRHPLPVPHRLRLPSVRQMLQKQSFPVKLLLTVKQSVTRGAQTFLFVPYVKQVEPMVRLIRDYAKELDLSPQAISGTSSQDEERADKVVAFRDRSVRLLVTTTILERGVTIPRSDVFILDAHNPLFDAASLVQMAGRAGRSGEDPFGFVYYGAPEWTGSQKSSIRQIRTMNRAARRQGYLRQERVPEVSRPL